jgi:ketosteroid isomerase-like protein
MAGPEDTDSYSAFVQEWVGAVNRADKEAFRTYWTEDATWESLATGFKVQGPDAITDWMWAWIDAFPDLYCDITEAFGCGDNGVLASTLRGTHQRELRIPGIVSKSGPIPPSGKTMAWPICFVVTRRDGLVSRFLFYADVMTLLTQLVAFPPRKPA